MALNTQFSIAVHLLVGLGCVEGGTTTSGHLAESVNTSASFVRRTLAKLSKAGLVETTTGKSGACGLAKKPERISLLEVYKAVDAPKAFAVHTYAPQKVCAVSCNIKAALENVLAKTQQGMEASLSKITLADVIADVRR